MESLIKNNLEMERYAKERLASILNYDISTLTNSDKPDLKDDVNSVGIEVVMDCYKEEMERTRFVEQIWGKPISEIDKRKVKIFEKNGGKLSFLNKRINGASLGNPTPNNPAHLIATIKKKILKLNEGQYKLYKSNRLYVFNDTVSPLYDSYVLSIMKEICSIKKMTGFDIIYIDGYYEFTVIDVNKKSYETIQLKKWIFQLDRLYYIKNGCADI